MVIKPLFSGGEVLKKMNYKIIWDNFLEKIKDKISTLSYETWFKDTSLYDIDNGIFRVIVPMSIHKTHLHDKYKDIIDETLSTIYTDYKNIEYFLQDEIMDMKQEEKINNNIHNEINNHFETNLIKKYTFENFVVGNSNRLAHATAVAVAENPGSIYNPLFIYGNSGLGKTHLMHAIGNYITEHSNKKVLYVTSDKFIEDFVGINKKNNSNNLDVIDLFKDKYRNIDVLIIDDIQFLGGTTQSQQEFFHTFNSLYNSNKQIIISSDRSPDDLKKLEDRLKTRFCWGITVDIQPPNFDLRVAIVKKKIAASIIEKNIPEDVIEYIAFNVSGDVRQLEGSINRLLAYSSMMGGCDITVDLAMDALTDYVSKGSYEKDDVHKIQRIVAEYFKISIEDLKSKKRNYNVAFPRQIAMYLCRNCTDESFPKLGIEFGGKDHSTVIHSCDKIERELKVNPELRQIIDILQKEIDSCSKK